MQTLYIDCVKILVMISRFITCFICILCFSFYFPVVSYGQIPGVNDEVSIGISPENPGANEPVSITLETYSFDLDSAVVKWYVNKNLAQEGKGLKKLTFETGNLGQDSVVTIIIDSSLGQITKNITITPSAVTILWEANTYTPPFFKGKALFSHQSTVTFMAQPQIVVKGKVVNPANLIYRWSKDGTVLGNQNGYGKQTLTLTGSVISRSMRIFVEVTDPQSGATASGVVTLNPVEPEILIYEVSPLYGTQYNKAIINSLPLQGNEVTLAAIPYFFSSQYAFNSGELLYKWSINGNTVSDNLNTNARVFRKVGDVSGKSNIEVRIEQPDKLLQFSSYNTVIDFLKDPSL